LAVERIELRTNRRNDTSESSAGITWRDGQDLRLRNIRFELQGIVSIRIWWVALTHAKTLLCRRNGDGTAIGQLFDTLRSDKQLSSSFPVLIEALTEFPAFKRAAKRLTAHPARRDFLRFGPRKCSRPDSTCASLSITFLCVGMEPEFRRGGWQVNRNCWYLLKLPYQKKDAFTMSPPRVRENGNRS
jgi:hypothetical protein